MPFSATDRALRRVPGAASADLFIGLGRTRDEVVAAVIRDIGITHSDAECARSAAAKTDRREPARG